MRRKSDSQSLWDLHAPEARLAARLKPFQKAEAGERRVVAVAMRARFEGSFIMNGWCILRR
jgi:hypothetical protein